MLLKTNVVGEWFAVCGLAKRGPVIVVAKEKLYMVCTSIIESCCGCNIWTCLYATS